MQLCNQFMVIIRCTNCAARNCEMGHDMKHHENGFSKQHPSPFKPISNLNNCLFPFLHVWNSLSQPYLSGSSSSNDGLPRNFAPFGNSSPHLRIILESDPHVPVTYPMSYPTIFLIFPIPIILFASRGSCVTQYHRHNNCAPHRFSGWAQWCASKRRLEMML